LKTRNELSQRIEVLEKEAEDASKRDETVSAETKAMKDRLKQQENDLKRCCFSPFVASPFCCCLSFLFFVLSSPSPHAVFFPGSLRAQNASLYTSIEEMNSQLQEKKTQESRTGSPRVWKVIVALYKHLATNPERNGESR
jgi:hypothetical protein